jgi:phosphoribosylformylglycinamidine synthase subunit PurS
VKARVTVTLKTGILDPQGKAIEGALSSLGFSGIDSVRQGKVFDVDLVETDPDKARLALDRMCQTLLANLVIEDYRIELA